MTSRPHPMSPTQDQEQRLLEAALALGTEPERRAFLAAIADPATRQRLGELVSASAEADSFFGAPPIQNAGVELVKPTPSSTPPAEVPAQMLGRYKLLEKIGEGGFGEVWMAEQREPVKRRVALKIIKLGMDSRQIVARFEAERQALAMMDHPNIAKIFDAGTTEGSNQKSVIRDQMRTPITDYCSLITSPHLPFIPTDPAPMKQWTACGISIPYSLSSETEHGFLRLALYQCSCSLRPEGKTLMTLLAGVAVGFIAWFLMRYLVAGIYTVDQNERAVKTRFGRAERIGSATILQDPIADHLRPEEKERYNYPQVRVIPPGGPYFKWPWERIHKVSIATQTLNMALDPENGDANMGGTVLEAVTKDQLNTGLTGQIRYRVAEKNLYAYLFAVKRPIVHVMGYFTAVLRERISNFEAPAVVLPKDGGNAIPTPEIATASVGVSINDLRKNLRDINEHMDRECKSSEARYGITLDASLITGIDPPAEVEAALAAINTAYNSVSSDISLAQAGADQKIVQSKTAVEIETLRAQAEVEPLIALADQLRELKKFGPDALPAYVRNVRLKLFSEARRAVLEVRND